VNEQRQQSIVAFGIHHVTARGDDRFPVSEVTVHFAPLHREAHLRGPLVAGDDIEFGPKHLVKHER